MSMKYTIGVINFWKSYIKLNPTDSVLILHNLHSNDEPQLKELLGYLRSYGVFHVVKNHNLLESLDEMIVFLNKFKKIIFLEKNTSTNSKEIMSLLKGSLLKAEVYRVFDFSKDLFETSFNLEQSYLKFLNESIIEEAKKTLKVKITSAAGTNLEFDFSKDYGWINSCGHNDGKHPVVLPVSEVATYSNNVNGILVADGAINTNFGLIGSPLLKNREIYITLKDSEIVHVECKDKLLGIQLEKFFKTTNANKVGEIGFGTNEGINHFIPFLSHVNERHPSFHLGVGSNNQGERKLGWQCPLHLDFILDECEIYFDENLILKNKKYFVDKNKIISNDYGVMYADTI